MKKKILIIAAFFATGVITSCKKDFLSLEVNPNTPSVTTPQFALTGALKVAADIPNLNYNIFGEWGGMAAPSGNFVPSPQVQQYAFTTDNFQVFAGLYTNATNFDNLEKIGAANSSFAYFQAIAKIMKAYDFEQLVDVYNNVPYSQAFNASTYLFPKYDKGSEIYDDLAKQLVAAIGIINANGGATNPGTSDIVYGGDMTKWKKFANTLLLRLAIRQSIKVGGGAAKGLLAGVAAEGYIDETSSAEANPGYTANGFEGQQSPFWLNFGLDITGNPRGSATSVRVNAYAVELFRNLNDPRISREYTLTTNGAAPAVYRGIIFGDPNAPQNPNSSTFGPGILKSPGMNAVLLSTAESFFLQSEGVLRFSLTGDAAALYTKGVKASFTATGVVLPEKAPNVKYTMDEYVALYTGQTADPNSIGLVNKVNFTLSSNKYETIITQKYLSLNGYGFFEAWNEFKRTGFPLGVPRSIDSKAQGTGIPNRIYYPTSEYGQNADAVKAEGTIDPFTSKIFWQP
jgi:hypothetical protein